MSTLGVCLYWIVAFGAFGRSRWEDERGFWRSLFVALAWPGVAAFHVGRWVGGGRE